MVQQGVKDYLNGLLLRYGVRSINLTPICFATVTPALITPRPAPGLFPFRFNEDMEGVVLSYTNERIVSQEGRVHPYFPFTRVQVTADVVLFKPALAPSWWELSTELQTATLASWF